jgi:hypothetical protein
MKAKLSKGYNNTGSFWWLKISFSDARASFQLACFTLLILGWADPVKITAFGEARNGGWFKKSRPLFLLGFENLIYWQIAF